MRYQLRIISGSLRGRKLAVTLDPELRPMTDRVRQALFSILTNEIEGRLFYDVFAGSGAVGIEALSRGAKYATFVERDVHAVRALLEHLQRFGVKDQAHVLRADAYKWADKCAPPGESAVLFLGPPYQEIERHFDAITWMLATLQQKIVPNSILILQSDKTFDVDRLPDAAQWDIRKYGRTQLAIWKKVNDGMTNDERMTE